MAHVYKAPNGKGWYCRWSFPDPERPDGRKFQKQVFRTQEQANAKRREVEDRRANGLPIDHRAGKQSLERWANEWHEHYARTVKPSTAAKSRGLLDATVIPRLGHLPIREVNVATVSDWLDYIEQHRTGHQKRPISPATIRHHYLVLSNVLQYAVTKRVLAFNPARDVRPPTNRARNRAPRKYQFLTPDDVAKLAEHLPHPYELLVEFLASTGLRVGEAAGLNIGDVDLINGAVSVERTRTKRACAARCDLPTCQRDDDKDGRQAKCPDCLATCDGQECCWVVGVPKNGKPREEPVPLPDGLVEYIRSHPHRDDLLAPLWPGRKVVSRDRHGSVSDLDYDQPWSPSVFYKRFFKPAVVASGLPPDLRLHDLRHSFASICASNGIPAAQVAVWMGHGNEVVTRTIYTHMFRDDTTKHRDALNAAFRREPANRDELAARRARRNPA